MRLLPSKLEGSARVGGKQLKKAAAEEKHDQTKALKMLGRFLAQLPVLCVTVVPICKGETSF